MTIRPPGSGVRVRVRITGGGESRAVVSLGLEGEAPATQKGLEGGGWGSWSRTFLPRPQGYRWEALSTWAEGLRDKAPWLGGSPRSREQKSPPCPLEDLLLPRRPSGWQKGETATKPPGFRFSQPRLYNTLLPS